MKEKKFILYDKKRTVKINLITSAIYILIIGICAGAAALISKSADRSYNDGWGYLGLILLVIFAILFILILYTVLLPLFLKLHNNYIDNLKNLVGVFVCNAVITVFMWNSFGYKFALAFIATDIFGMLLTLTLKHRNIEKKSKID